MIVNGVLKPKITSSTGSSRVKRFNGSPRIMVFFDEPNASADVKLFINYLRCYISKTTYLVDFCNFPHGSQITTVLSQKYNINYRCFILLSTTSYDLLKYCVPYFRKNTDTLCFSTYSTFNFESGVLPFNVIRTSVNDYDLVNYIVNDVLYNLKELTVPSNFNDFHQSIPSSGSSPTGDELPIFTKIVYIYSDLDDLGDADMYSSGYLSGLIASVSTNPYITIESYLVKRSNFVLPDVAKLRLTENPVSGITFAESVKTIFCVNGLNPNTLLHLLTDENMYDNYFIMSDAYVSSEIRTLYPIKYGIMPIGNFSFGGYKFAGLINSPTGHSISPQILSVVDLIVEMSPIYANAMSKKQSIETIKTTLENLKYIVDNNYWFERKIFTYLAQSDITQSNKLNFQYIFFQFKFNPLTSGTFINPNELSQTISSDITDTGNISLSTFLRSTTFGLNGPWSEILPTDVPFGLMMSTQSEYNDWITALNASVGGSRFNWFVNGNVNHTPLMLELWRSQDERFVPIQLSCSVNLLVFANVPTVYTISQTLSMTQKSFNTWGQQHLSGGGSSPVNIQKCGPVSSAFVDFVVDIETDPLLPEDLANGITYIQYFSGNRYYGSTRRNTNIGAYGNFDKPVLANYNRVLNTGAANYYFSPSPSQNIFGVSVCHTHAMSPVDTTFFGSKSISIGPNGESTSFPIGQQCAVLSNVGFIKITLGAKQWTDHDDVILSFWAIGIDANNVSTVGDTTMVWYDNKTLLGSNITSVFQFAAPVGVWTKYDVRIPSKTDGYSCGFKSANQVSGSTPTSKLRTAIQVIDCASGHFKGMIGDYYSPVIVNVTVNPTIVYNKFYVDDYVWCIPPDLSTPFPGKVTAITDDFQSITVKQFTPATQQIDDPLYCYVKPVSPQALFTFAQTQVIPIERMKSGTMVDTELWGVFKDKTVVNSSGITTSSSIISQDNTYAMNNISNVPSLIRGISTVYSSLSKRMGITHPLKMMFISQADYLDWVQKCSAIPLANYYHYSSMLREICRSNKLQVLTVNVDAPIVTTSTPTSYNISQTIRFNATSYSNNTPTTISKSVDIYLDTPLITSASASTNKIYYLIYNYGNEYLDPNVTPPISGNTDFQSVTNGYIGPLLLVITVVPPTVPANPADSSSSGPSPPPINTQGTTGATGSSARVIALGAVGATPQTWTMVGASGVYWTQTVATGTAGSTWVIHVPQGVTPPTSMVGATLVMSGPAPPVRYWGGTGWVYSKGIIDSSSYVENVAKLNAIGLINPF